MSWHIVRWDEEKVRAALKRGRYDDVSLTGWGRLDDLVALSHELGVFQEFERLEASMKGGGYIPTWFLNTALLFPSYVGDESINGMQSGLFRDAGVTYAWGDGGGDAGGVRGGSQWWGTYAVSRR